MPRNRDTTATDDGPWDTAGSGGTIGDLARWLSHTAGILRGGSTGSEEYDPRTDGPLVSFDGAESAVDRYWLNAPFAFAVVTHDPEVNEHRYYAVEPDLDGFEQELLSALLDDIRDPMLYRDREGDPEAVLRDELGKRLEEYGVDIDAASFHRVYYYLHRTFRGYGKIDPLMHDPYIEDISCDGYGLPLFVYHSKYTDVETDISFDEEELDTYVVRLAQSSGRHISVSDPMVEATLPDGSRAELAFGEEVTPRGSAFTVRRYSEEPFTPVDLLNHGTYSLDQLAYLWLAIENRRNVIFAGGTAAGKTTSMNAVSMFVPPRAKVITIEDTRELALHHDNWLSSVTRERLGEEADITMYDLLRSALRHRPEYIIVGEVRGEEAITLFQAMNTGHTTFSTMHADSVQTVINRLENEPINVPRQMVRSLDVLSVQVLTRMGGERVRRARTIAEIEGIDSRTGELDYSTAYSWSAPDDGFTESGSDLLDEIREGRGWTETELLREFRNRRRFLGYLQERDVTDYRRFTAMVNKYYADPEDVMETIEDVGLEAPVDPST